MHEVATSIRRGSTPPTRMTTNSVDCDPQCRYRLVCDELVAEKRTERDQIIAAHGYGNDSDENADVIRLSEQGHAELEVVNISFKGLAIMEAAVINCRDANRCTAEAVFITGREFGPAIEDALDPYAGQRNII